MTTLPRAVRSRNETFSPLWSGRLKAGAFLPSRMALFAPGFAAAAGALRAGFYCRFFRIRHDSGPFFEYRASRKRAIDRARIIAQWLQSHHRGRADPVRNVGFLQAN